VAALCVACGSACGANDDRSTDGSGNGLSVGSSLTDAADDDSGGTSTGDPAESSGADPSTDTSGAESSGSGGMSGCAQDQDCASLVCADGTCLAPTCEDGVANGDETDFECGGSECPKCDVCLHCSEHTDCAPGVCEDDLCAPTIVITSATYAANCGAPTMVQTIFDECNGKQTCDYVFNYVEDVGFDPAYGCMKDLTVEYTCTGGMTVKSFYEACAPCDDQNTPTQIHLDLECDACLGVGMPPG
jgi:hypothetical protein